MFKTYFSTITCVAVATLVICLAGGASHVLSKPPESAITASYIAAAEAMAADNFERARAAIVDLATRSEGKIKDRAEAVVGSKDLKTMRLAFRELSENVIALGVPIGYEVIICRMFHGGSRWIQKIGTIANPYWGRIMLDCGTPESSIQR